MCGISGLINIGDKNILQKMNDMISHRGPDNDTIKWFNKTNSGIGHRRLSIIDLSTEANQPMENDNSRYWITYNGELYNYKEIRKDLVNKGYSFKTRSDTEVVLKSYEEYGADCLQEFNGMFSFAIYDVFEESLFAARDHVGIKPFYYKQTDNGIAFCSEIKSIINSKLFDIEPDLTSLTTPTRFQISPYTGFKDIFKLPPAHYLKFIKGNLSIHRYWDIKPYEKKIDENLLIDSLDSHLNRAIKMQMVSDVPVGAFLSGGLDSSLITALMQKHTNKTINTFTIRFHADDNKYESMSNDSVYAKQVAKYFEFNHKEIVISPNIVDLLPKLVWHLDEPLADPAAINTYLISDAARQAGIIVLLNGMGGDEIFGGYRKQFACLKAELIQKLIPSFISNRIYNLISYLPTASRTKGYRNIRWAKRFSSFANLGKIERFLSSDLSMNPHDFNNAFKKDISYYQTHFYKSQIKHFENTNISYLTQMCLNDTVNMLTEHNLTYSDKASMAASVETRPPLTDIDLITYAFTFPPSMRIKNNIQKYILKKVSEPYLDNKIVYRPKASFGAPLRSWIRGPLLEMVDDLLSETRLKERNLYNPKYVLNKIRMDRNGKEDNSHFIWQLLTTEIWFQQFIDK